MAVKWSIEAFQSLENIAEYIGQFNPERAESFVQEIKQKTKILEAHPNIGRTGRIDGTRELVAHKNYIVVYRTNSEDIEIIFIRHVARK